MNLISLLDRFNSDYACRGYLETLRWPNGVACSRCGGMDVTRIKKSGPVGLPRVRIPFLRDLWNNHARFPPAYQKGVCSHLPHVRSQERGLLPPASNHAGDRI